MTTSSDLELGFGFAKLKGEDFEYYMQKYSIVLGRNSKKKSDVDVDLASSSGGMNISRHHARIFFDFQRRGFFLEVLGKNGCFVEGVLYMPKSPPVELHSQDMFQIGDKEIYFLLPVRSILSGPSGPRNPAPDVEPRPVTSQHHEKDAGGSGGGNGGSGSKAGSSSQLEKEALESDNQQLLVLEEKDVVSSVATVLSDLRGPARDWVPMQKLHYELVERFGDVWHHGLVRKYLTSEDYPSTEEALGKPWYGLLMLLRKYPQHFVIDARFKGPVMLEFVSLVS